MFDSISQRFFYDLVNDKQRLIGLKSLGVIRALTRNKSNVSVINLRHHRSSLEKRGDYH